MTTIYVVTSGRHSDYGIEAIYSTKPLAEIHCNLPVGPYSDQPSIEEWELDVGEEHLRRGDTPYLIHIAADGVVKEITDCSWNGFTPGQFGPHYERGVHIKGAVWVELAAKDEEHARKAASEWWVQEIYEKRLKGEK